MGDTPAATISAAIEGYKERRLDQVLEQFHDEAMIIGTREDERWNSKEEVHTALEQELARVHVEGPLTETGAEESFTRQMSDDMATYYRDGYLVFNEKRVRGRWSAVMMADEKGNWSIVHSHFSLAEGHTTPNATGY